MRSEDSDRMVPSLRLDCIDGLGTFDLFTIGEVQREEGFDDFLYYNKINHRFGNNNWDPNHRIDEVFIPFCFATEKKFGHFVTR